MVSAASAAVAVAYMNTETVFEPVVTITVPDIDGLSGVEITVSFAPVLNSHADCTVAVSEVWVIGSGGVVARQGEQAVVSLVALPQGQTSRCEYAVTFVVTGAGAGDLALPTVGPFMVSGASTRVVAGYVPSRNLVFSPVVDIGVPVFGPGDGSFPVTTFTVTFTRVSGSNVGCTETASEVWEFTGGVVVRSAGQMAAVLVNFPQGVVSSCLYDVNLETVTAGSGGDGLVLTSTGPFTASAESASVDADYVTAESMFDPDVTISAPVLDDNEDGEEDFLRINIRITFSPVANSDPGCTASVSVTWRVRVGGDATLVGGQTPVSLVNRPAGVTRPCSYDVSFRVLGAGVDRLALETAGAFMVSAVASPVAVRYVNTATMFSPAVAVEVPAAGPDGASLPATTFTATFSRVAAADAGCTA